MVLQAFLKKKLQVSLHNARAKEGLVISETGGRPSKQSDGENNNSGPGRMTVAGNDGNPIYFKCRCYPNLKKENSNVITITANPIFLN